MSIIRSFTDNNGDEWVLLGQLEIAQQGDRWEADAEASDLNHLQSQVSLILDGTGDDNHYRIGYTVENGRERSIRPQMGKPHPAVLYRKLLPLRPIEDGFRKIIP